MRDHAYPISLPQKDVYYEQLLYRESAIYNIGAKVEVRGYLDPIVFRKAALHLVRQHDSLRTVVFLNAEGDPYAKVLPDAEPEIIYSDFSLAPDPLAQAEEFIQREFQQPFDIRGDILLNKYYLVKVSGDFFYIVGKYHHLVADGWSTSLLFSRLAHNYACFKDGLEPGETGAAPYVDFIIDDLEYQASEEFTADKSYWKNKFDRFDPGTLPDFGNGAVAEKPVGSKRKEIYLSREIYDRMIAFSQAQTISVFHFLLGVTYLYFSSVFDESRLIFGLPLLNRKSKKFKSIVGLFAGITPLLMNVDRGSRFTEVLKEIRNELRENFRHQRLPLSAITAGAGWLKAGNHRPIYQIFFSYEKHDYSIQFGGHPSTVIPLTHQLERAPLAIYIREFDDTKDVKIDFDYNVNYFDASFIASFSDRFQSLIGELMADPGRRIGELGVLSKEEERQLVEVFNDTSMAVPAGKTVADLLWEQAARTPERIALEHEGLSLSYRELEERSDRLARYLRGHWGIGRNDLVGIMTGRSEQMVIGIMGIIKSGGAYVPIDPDHPESRVSYILEQSRVRVVLTEDRYRDRVASKGYAAIVLPVEDTGAASDMRSLHQEEDLLYVMYTSGSTGRPKGVEIEHRSVVNFLISMIEKLGIRGTERMLAVTTYSFDISVLELLLPLVSGGTVMIMGKEKVQDAGQLSRSITSLRPDIMQCTPGMWQMLLDAGWRGDRSLQALCGGERLGKDLAGRLLEEVKELWNMYGPTETTIWSAMNRIGQQEDALSIGGPIGNTEMYILNSRRQLLPVGVTGELYIGGKGLARGYKDQAELTGERFIGHPFKVGERLYRTGDIGKWTSDGRITFMGRRDEQVKIRGYRVEPAEIEYVLSGHPEVGSTVVVAERGEDGSNYLVAYVVLLSAVRPSDLREYVRGELPEYMVPNYFIQMDKLPLSANGKVDKKALPGVREVELLGAGMEYVGASNRIELELVRIWEEVLSRDRVGIRDIFFEIGGHSLRAVQILTRIHKELGVEVGLHELFNNPRIADLGKIIQMRGPKELYEEIGVVAEQEYYALSPGQRRLWILSRFPEGSLAYNISGAYRMRGALDGESFGRALMTVMERHESLRTVFITVEGMPMQKVCGLEETGFVMEELDLRMSGGVERAEELAKKELETGFDLSRGPLVRAKLLRTGEEEYVFLLTLHHIITDGWSMEVIVREVIGLYEAYRAGKPGPLQKLRIQYKDYAGWQNEQIRSERMEIHRQYWMEQFHGEIPIPELPTDGKRPEMQTFKGNLYEYRLDGELSKDLRKLSREHHATLFVTLLALFKVLLYKYTDQQDIVVGVPVAGRDHGDTYDQVGFFVNMVAMRTKMSDEDSFLTIQEKVKEVVIGAYAHQVYPFDMLIEKLNLPRDMSRSPLFDIVVGMDTGALGRGGDPVADGLLIEKLPRGHVVSKYDLTLTFKDTDKGIAMAMEYNTDLYGAGTIAGLLDRYIQLLRTAVADPGRRIGEVSVLSKEEERQLVEVFNDTTMAVPADKTVADLLWEQAARTPERIALEYEGLSLSYRELEERSDRLARYLREHWGIGRNDLVGIMTGRSEQMVIGIMGIIKSGGAYVPIDPDHPESRVSYILDQSRVRVVLTEDRYRDRVADKGYAAIILPVESVAAASPVLGDDTASPVLREDTGAASDMRSLHQEEDLLYVMYTSGSTGRPKGVEIEHRSVVNFLISMIEKLGIRGTERMLAVTTYSFDISVLELLLPLVSGGTVMIMGKEKVQDAGQLSRSITSLRPDIMQCTPGMWQMLLDAGWRGDRSLQALCGGERLGKDLAGRLLGEVKELWNMYGPTETTIWSGMNRIGQQEDALSIGGPIGNTEMYILNSRRQLLPVGVTGELYIGGRGLARGYKDQAELTGERFIDHPFKAGERLYRTGDIGKWTSDGRITFMGRRDEQVKIRGYRVEPAEIEYVLSGHPEVGSTVVVAERGEDGSNYLVAYVVLSSAVRPSELREYVRGELPEYMVPNYFIQMDKLPLSANGKVDKKALPGVREVELLGAGMEYVGASNRIELELVRIWEEVLSRDRVGIRDIFFEIGGHSLRAVQILTRIHKELGVEVGLHELFNNPRIADLGKIIQMRGPKELYEEIGVVAEQEYYALSPGQRRLWILSRFPEGSLAYNISGAYRMRGTLDGGSFGRALMTVMERHESLRTVFITVEGMPMQKICGLEETGFVMGELDLRMSGGVERAEELAKKELETGFDLSRGPLVRAKLLRTGEEEYVFLLTLHHIITDGWSMEVIVREVIGLYEAYRAGKPGPLQKLRIQYKDYAGWQNEQIRSERMEIHRQYWMEQFRGEIPVLELPIDYPRPTVLSSRGGRIIGRIGEDNYRRLSELATRKGSSMNILLMTLVKVLLYRYTGQTDIIVGYPMSMRNNVELEGQVGFYLNTIALRTKIKGSDSFRDVAGKVKEGLFKAYEHQLYPFDKLVGNLGLVVDTNRFPLFDVVVVLQNLSIHKDELHDMGNMIVDTIEIDYVTSGVDLRLEFIERADHIIANFEYNKGLFKEDTIRKFMDRFSHLLSEVLADPGIHIEDIGFESEKINKRADTLSNHFTLTF